MLRIGVVILVLTAIAVTQVHIRRRQAAAAHQVQRLQGRQVVLRRRLWDQQVVLGRLGSPRRIARRVEEIEARRGRQWLAAVQPGPAADARQPEINSQ